MVVTSTREPYKCDFFRLFVAWDAGLLKRTGRKALKLDNLISLISASDPKILTEKLG